MSASPAAVRAPDLPAAAPSHERRGIGPGAFLGVAVVSFGGPLALAGLVVPQLLGDQQDRAGLVALAGAAAFVVPLLLWLRCDRQVTSSGGLTAYVATAAGRPLALVQGGLWLASYVLYLGYTPDFVVYQILPAVTPGVRPYRWLVELLLPAAIAGLMVVGRRFALAVVAVVAGGQLALLAVLAAVAVGHSAPASSFSPPAAARAGGFGTAAGSVALLYVCGSLPFFFGSEVGHDHRSAHRTIARGLWAAYAVSGALVVLAVFPLAHDPAFLSAAVPGASFAGVVGGQPLGVAVGLGVAASTLGLVLLEFLTVPRAAGYLFDRPVSRLTPWVAGLLAVSGPICLIDPGWFTAQLEPPSMVALWLSLLVVAVVSPRLGRAPTRAVRAGRVGLAAGGAAFALYGLWTAVRGLGS